MRWNWESKNWPNFEYDLAELDGLEEEFLKKSGHLLGAYTHVAQGDKEDLIVDIISEEALKTSLIEGEYLNRESIQSSIKKQFGLQTELRKISPAEYGIAEMMVDLYQRFDTPLSHEMIFTWHKMLCNGRRDLLDIGRYRSSTEPMQVVSGAIGKTKVHFEAPPSAVISKEMDRFVEWFEVTRTPGPNRLKPLQRAGIAHLYFVCIHPLEDGNGRIGRAIAEKALAEGLGHPSLIALSYTIEKHKKDYYAALERNNRHLEITDWLQYFSKTIIEAQQNSIKIVGFVVQKAKLFDKLKGLLNERQEKLLNRMFREGIEGFKGGLSVKNYIAITSASRATATRDLQDLVAMGALLRSGELKGTRYFLNLEGF